MTNTSEPPGRQAESTWVPVAVIGVLLVVTVAAWLTVPRFRELLGWGRPDRSEAAYLELYFKDVAQIPRDAAAGQAINLPFVVVSHGDSGGKYGFFVTATVDGESSPVDAGTFELASGQSQELSTTFVPGRSGVTYQVAIRLAPGAETITVRIRT
ncbi:MAG: hypothetical protein LCH86_16175 [Proteobacteria bacterium]|nr:hypothetical protein [Pseudomonadota bacterium]